MFLFQRLSLSLLTNIATSIGFASSKYKSKEGYTKERKRDKYLFSYAMIIDFLLSQI